MGAVRFALTVYGVPDALVEFASMTAVIVTGTIYFALTTDTHKDRLLAAFLLIMPYMIVEVAALTYTWISGRNTIFHTPGHSFNTTIAQHTLGHIAGGLTWEPLMTFAVSEFVWLIGVAVPRELGLRKT